MPWRRIRSGAAICSLDQAGLLIAASHPGLRRQRLHDNRALWQPELLLRHNLEAVLGLELPRRQATGMEDASADCAICYAYWLLPQGAEAAEGDEGEHPLPHGSAATWHHGRLLSAMPGFR
jgi:hypothetical protein